jgi:hypothetical protein
MKIRSWKTVAASAALLALGVAGAAQAEDQPAAAPAGPTALSTPAMSSSLAANANPFNVDAGPLGKIYFSGQFTGLATWQNYALPGDNDKGKADFSNAQIEVQKTDGVVQFYVQAGIYNFPSLGTAYVYSGRLTDETYKYVPVAFFKIVPNSSFNIMIGKLPTLIGSEYTFTFQNLISYVLNPKDTIAFAASGNFGKTPNSSFVTPLAQNNGSIYNLMWTHTDGPWVVNPYLQYSTTPKDLSLGLQGSSSTIGGAVLVKYSFNPMFNLAGRAEYISSSGSEVSLLYGPNSKAWSLTLTPTFQLKTFFVRGELSYTKLDSATPGAGFGPSGNKADQTRAMVETGFLF